MDNLLLQIVIGCNGQAVSKKYAIVTSLVVKSETKSALGDFGMLQGKMAAFPFHQGTVCKDK